MQIRQMTEDDIELVVNLERNIFPDPWMKSSFEYELNHNQFSTPLILEQNEEIVGYAIIWKIFEELHLANLAIRPEFRGRKLGTYFLKKILERKENCSYALLEVRESNRPAIRLYQKFGFRTILKRPRYYKNGETALVMQKIFKQKLSNNKKTEKSGRTSINT